ncbi:hypothetical protein [Paenisporosarcina quisquiliarum]|uniref:hypothetical protein n=1 Tax=Paenisporosarcina quisquiliarum TaxID=365346 RepID=UPI003736642E
MKKGKITLLGIFATLFVVIFLFINNTATKGETSGVHLSPEIQEENEKKFNEVEEFSTLLHQKGGLFEEVSTKLKEKGYASFQIMIETYSKDDIRVKYILENNDATESVQKEVKSIFFESVENHNLDSNSFNLKVSDTDDGPDW